MFPIVIDEFLISKIGIQLLIDRAYFLCMAKFYVFQQLWHNAQNLRAFYTCLQVSSNHKILSLKTPLQFLFFQKPTRLAEYNIEFFAVLYPGEVSILVSTKMSTSLVFGKIIEGCHGFSPFLANHSHSQIVNMWCKKSEVESVSIRSLVITGSTLSASKVATWSSTSVRFLLKNQELGSVVIFCSSRTVRDTNNWTDWRTENNKRFAIVW